MEFGLDKCATVNIKRGKCDRINEDMTLLDGTLIKCLENSSSYTYLVVSSAATHNVAEVKEAVSAKYLQ